MTTFSRTVKPKWVAKKKMRLDKYLHQSGLGISRSQIQHLIEKGNVLINGKPVKASHFLKLGDEVTVEYKKPEKFRVEPEDIPLDIVYEDKDVVVVNKSPGMVTHPAPGNLRGTLVNALLHHCDLAWRTDKTRPGVLHRLDKDTSGLIIFAKTDMALPKLARQVETRRIKRGYLAFVWGRIGVRAGTIDVPIGRHTVERKRMAVTPLASRAAVTHFKVLQRFNYASYLQVELETGRTHQIRVHMSHIGHPVIGDTTYRGVTKPPQVPQEVFNQITQIMRRQALHAAVLKFEHPVTKKELEFKASLPADMQKLLEFLNVH